MFWHSEAQISARNYDCGQLRWRPSSVTASFG